MCNMEWPLEYNATVRVGIDNLLDEDPTFFPETFANDFDPAYRTCSMHYYKRFYKL